MKSTMELQHGRVVMSQGFRLPTEEEWRMLRKLHYILKAISMSKMVRKHPLPKRMFLQSATNEVGICDIL